MLDGHKAIVTGGASGIGEATVRQLAKLKGKSLTATIREAVENEYRHECQRRNLSLLDRIKLIQAKAAALAKPGGKRADKAFYDELSGEF